VHVSSSEDKGGIGAGFFLKIAGLCVVGGLIAMVSLLIFWRAVYAWGFFGAFLALAAGLCIWGWLFDRRQPST
jgi:hypothetical protein